MPTTTPVDLQSLVSVIRTELKLDASADLNPETALIGGEHDLDSLDVLMLVTSIEKRFGIKIPNDSIGREVFQSVGTLLDYLNRAAAGGGSGRTDAGLA